MNQDDSSNYHALNKSISEAIEEAISRSNNTENTRYRHSVDILGEAANGSGCHALFQCLPTRHKKAGGPHYLYRFMTERTISTNTSALGGNANLLSFNRLM